MPDYHNRNMPSWPETGHDQAIRHGAEDGSSIAAEPNWLEWWRGQGSLKRLVPAFAAACYVAAHLVLGGLRGDHLALAGAFLGLYYGGPKTRSLYSFLLPVILMIACYDSQRYYADIIRGRVRVLEPYLWDEFLFGLETGRGVLLLPSQWWQQHTHPGLDFLTGLVYIAFVPVFVLTAAYYRFRLGRRDTAGLVWGLFWVSLISSLTYYIYPAAPPWYVDLYGLGPAQLDAAPTGAGAVRFDALFGITLLTDYYSRTPNVFGAIPSLHVAYPLLTVYYALKFRALRFFSILYYCLICLAAVYLNHHYVVDLVWGAAYAVITVWVTERFYLGKFVLESGREK